MKARRTRRQEERRRKATRRCNTCNAAEGWHSKQAAQARPRKHKGKRNGKNKGKDRAGEWRARPRCEAREKGGEGDA